VFRFRGPVRVAGLFLNEPLGHEPQGYWSAAQAAEHLNGTSTETPITARGIRNILHDFQSMGGLASHVDALGVRQYRRLPPLEAIVGSTRGTPKNPAVPGPPAPLSTISRSA
jgi:hypothetical protein